MEDADGRDSFGACDRDRQAIRRHREKREAGLVGPQPVGVLAAHAWGRLEDAGGVHLVVERELLDVGPDRVARKAPVLVDALDLVAALAAEVERRVRPLAHAADPRRERALVPGYLPPDHGRSFARASSALRVFRAGSSTTTS